jgi:hypothetical protein
MHGETVKLTSLSSLQKTPDFRQSLLKRLVTVGFLKTATSVTFKVKASDTDLKNAKIYEMIPSPWSMHITRT